MLARCARCHATFTTDRFGVQRCPHCGAELLLADPDAPPPGAPPPAPPPGEAAPGAGPGPAPGAAAPPAGPGAPPAAAGPHGPGPGDLPPPPGAPPGGYGWGAPPPGPPPGGWGPPPPGWGPPGQHPGGWGPLPPGALPGGPEQPAPFAERSRLGLVAAFFETWKLVATQPQQFFRRVRADQSGSAVLFGVIAFTVGYAVQALYGLLAGAQSLGLARQFADRMPAEQRELLFRYLEGLTGWTSAAQVVLAPLLGVVSIYLTAAILHVVLLLLRATPRRFDATLTTVGYAYGLALLLAVPACGSVLYLVWHLVVLVVGLGEAQRCGPGKAAVAVFAPFLLVCVCCCGVFAVGLGGLLNLGPGVAPGGGVNL